MKWFSDVKPCGFMRKSRFKRRSAKTPKPISNETDASWPSNVWTRVVSTVQNVVYRLRAGPRRHYKLIPLKNQRNVNDTKMPPMEGCTLPLDTTSCSEIDCLKIQDSCCGDKTEALNPRRDLYYIDDSYSNDLNRSYQESGKMKNQSYRKKKYNKKGYNNTGYTLSGNGSHTAFKTSFQDIHNVNRNTRSQNFTNRSFSRRKSGFNKKKVDQFSIKERSDYVGARGIPVGNIKKTVDVTSKRYSHDSNCNSNVDIQSDEIVNDKVQNGVGICSCNSKTYQHMRLYTRRKGRDRMRQIYGNNIENSQSYCNQNAEQSREPHSFTTSNKCRSRSRCDGFRADLNTNKSSTPKLGKMPVKSLNRTISNCKIKSSPDGRKTLCSKECASLKVGNKTSNSFTETERSNRSCSTNDNIHGNINNNCLAEICKINPSSNDQNINNSSSSSSILPSCSPSFIKALYNEGLLQASPVTGHPVLTIGHGFYDSELQALSSKGKDEQRYKKSISEMAPAEMTKYEDLFLPEHALEPLVDGLPESVWINLLEDCLPYLATLHNCRHRKSNLSRKKAAMSIIDDCFASQGDCFQWPNPLERMMPFAFAQHARRRFAPPLMAVAPGPIRHHRRPRRPAPYPRAPALRGLG